MQNASIHSYSWLPGWSMDRAAFVAERAAHFGFSHVVVPMRDHGSIDPDRIARAFAEHRVTPVTTANQLPDADVSSLDREVRRKGLERHRRSLRLARDMGAPHMGGVLYGLLGKMTTPATRDNLEAAAESLAALADDAKVQGVRLALEIVNRYESNLVNTVDQALELVGLIGRDNVHLHLDTFHMNIEEADPLAALERALPRLAYFELDQNDRGLPHRGAIDFRPMLARLRAASYTGLVGVEAFSNAVSGPELQAGVSIWRDLFRSGDEVARSAAEIIREQYLAA
jgi:D-psicose/D-tagatose/L-ribulose 3-epimerase